MDGVPEGSPNQLYLVHSFDKDENGNNEVCVDNRLAVNVIQQQQSINVSFRAFRFRGSNQVQDWSFNLSYKMTHIL